VRATRIASEVLEGVFCGRGGCRPDAVEHMIHVDEASASDHDGSLVEPAAGG
jgi:hypothetical protein